MKTIEIKRAGLKLVGTLEIPELEKDETCHLVLLLHGFTGNRMEEIHTNLAEKLKKKKIASLRVDFNGHGESEGLFEDMTVMNEVEDAREILRYAKKLPFVDGISILGHSQGGVVAGMLAGYAPHEFKCLVQMAPAATLKDDAIKGTLMGVEYDPANIPEYISFWDKRLNSLYFSMAQKLPIYEVSAQYKGPVCLIHGQKDQVVSAVASEKYHETYANSELHMLAGQDHIFQNDLDEATQIAVEFISNIISQ